MNAKQLAIIGGLATMVAAVTAAWAADRNGEPLYPLVPGGARQRELAIRGGINLAMYTLTGNYKSDQVHVRDLLDRLGH